MTDAAVTTVDTGARRVSRRVAVNAPAAEIFALIADPHRHAELDGSGTVRDVPVKGPHTLTVGDRFTVGMRQFGLPYSITSVVTGLEPDRLVEWRHPLGHHWRWELAETTPGVTEVTETFDYSTARSPRVMELLGYPGKNAHGITETLGALARRFAG
ncbi:SRPBCC family protein [Actinoplanes sp. NPDC049265]|uniref:SRPBCC family protein n=1 Tax=Actinoplanes sp. NPDC049265 TaxID=3363902 RepID=UPI0037146374